MKLYQSEMPGPFKEERLTPRLADTARTLWVTYLALGITCTLAYWLAGVPFFYSGKVKRRKQRKGAGDKLNRVAVIKTDALAAG